MRDIGIQLSLVHFISLLDCRIEKRVNEHGRAVICGYITNEDEEQLIVKNTANTFAKLTMADENNNEYVLFHGLVESITIEHGGDLLKAEVTLVGGTRLMDSMRYTRTFQNAGMTYSQVLDSVENSYSEIINNMQVTDRAIGDLIVQYKENDWTFVKRLASHFNTCIIPYYKNAGINYYFGLRENNFKDTPKVSNYTVRNTSADFISYKIISRDVLDLGEGINFNGVPVYVYSMESNLVGAELVHTYIVKRAEEFYFPKQYNDKIIGASLDATILAVSGDMVKVCVNVDGYQEKALAKWFAYSTVYSSPDGAGWFCMPEENDRVRLYFPNEKEGTGYIISSIHIDTELESKTESGGDTNIHVNVTQVTNTTNIDIKGNKSSSSAGKSPVIKSSAPRSNPDEKTIITKDKKMVQLSPSRILITNSNGMAIVLDDAEGILITSDKDITIQSEALLSLQSKTDKMQIIGMESVELIQGDSIVKLEDDITFESKEVKIQ